MIDWDNLPECGPLVLSPNVCIDSYYVPPPEIHSVPIPGGLALVLIGFAVMAVVRGRAG